jgi:hypothetical protein
MLVLSIANKRRPVRGRGDLVSQPALIAGAGLAAWAGTGALSGTSTIDGAGITKSTGTGALVAQASQVDGAGDAGNVVAGTGALSAQGSTIAGAGTSKSTGTGALASGVSTVSGSGSAASSDPFDLDGAAVVNQGTSGATSAAVTLSTTHSNCIVVVMVTIEDSPNTIPTVTSITDTAGLTWAKRASTTNSNSANGIETWWALAPSPLVSDVITVHTDFFDDITVTAFAVSGANTGSPWDTNGSLPALNNGSGNNAPSVSGVSTTATDTIVFSFAGDAQNPQFVNGAGTGYTQLAAPHNNGRNNWSNGECQYKAFSSAQSSITVAPATLNSNVDWVIIADAIRKA